jgi:hypothetical protein
MNRNLLAVALIASGLIAPAALAQGTHTVNVQAVVIGTCKFNSAGPTLVNVTNGGAGSTIDPSLTGAGAAVGSANITFRCTANTTSSMDVAGVPYAGPVARTLTSGSGSMGYTLTLTGAAQPGTGFGAGGSDLTLAVGASIAEVVWSVAAADTYTESVVLTVNP